MIGGAHLIEDGGGRFRPQVRDNRGRELAGSSPARKLAASSRGELLQAFRRCLGMDGRISAGKHVQVASSHDASINTGEPRGIGRRERSPGLPSIR